VRAETATIALTIPAGVDDGQTLRVAGGGESAPGGGAGDLYVVLCVDDDERFIRQGADVTSEVSISFTQAALGGEVEVDTLDGDCADTAVLEIAPGTQPGDLIIRRGQGVPRVDGPGRGDHVVELVVEVPRRLTRRQEEILREFAAECGESKRAKKKRAR
jgi:molecular chaperone DnaJ